MSSFHGLVASAGSTALGVILISRMTPWRFVLGIIFVGCGIFTLIDYVRTGSSK